MNQVQAKFVNHFELSKLVSSILNRYITIQQLYYDEVPDGFMYTPRYFWLMDGKTKKLKAAVPEVMTDTLLVQIAQEIVTEIVAIITDEEVRKYFGRYPNG
jgi:hypothetical protein